MKTATVYVWLLLILVLYPSASNAQEKSDGLLTAPYPGSVFEANPVLSGVPKSVVDARGRTFYTKDSIDKVKAHYTKLLGEFEDASGGEHLYRREVILFKDVVQLVGKRGGIIGEGGDNFYGGAYAGVTLSAPMTNPNGTMAKVLDQLQRAYLLRFQNAETLDLADLAKHAEDPELKQIQSRYEHLKWSYFLQSKEKGKDTIPGGRAVDDVIYDRYFVTPEKDRQKELEELQKKMNQATTQMRYDEATALGDRLTKLAIGPKDPRESMDIVMKCLQELDKNAYATKIFIDAHPSKWVIRP
jgi:UvrB/UvrC motif-containing protein